MKSKHINWTLGFKCMWPVGWTWAVSLTLNFQGQIWLWPHTWPKPWIFMVKFWNNCISGMRGLIDIEQKGWESVIHDYGHDLLVTKVKCKDLLDSSLQNKIWKHNFATIDIWLRRKACCTDSNFAGVGLKPSTYFGDWESDRGDFRCRLAVDLSSWVYDYLSMLGLKLNHVLLINIFVPWNPLMTKKFCNLLYIAIQCWLYGIVSFVGV